MKLNYKRTFFIGFAFLSICAFWQMYDNIIPLILQNTFHLNETIIGLIMSADNVLAVFLLPLIGTMSDRVDTPLGKRTPFIIVGTVVAVATMMLIPAADSHHSLVLFVVALGVTLVAMAMYRTPAVALMPDLTPKPLRSKANAIINLMGAIGGVYALLLIKFLVSSSDHPSYFPVFAGIGIIMIAAILLLLVTIREKKIAAQMERDDQEEVIEEKIKEEKGLPHDVQKSLWLILVSIFLWFAAYNAVTTAFSRYATTVWKMQGGGFANCLMVATVAAILSYIPIGMISQKFGRKKTIMGGLVLMLISYCAAFWYPAYNGSINLFFGMIGIGWASINVNSLPMVVEMSKDSDIGKYTGLYYTFSMTAQIFTPVLSGALLQYVSYRTLFPYAVVFTICAMVTMSQVRHGDAKPVPKKSVLEHFDVED